MANLKCKISLSKKIRSILRNGGSIVLASDSINGGKGEGTLVIKDRMNKELEIEELFGQETSIIITPIEEIETPLNSTVSNIFYDKGEKSNNQRTLIDKIAATEIPENNNHSYYNKDEIQVPEQFQETQDQGFINYVRDCQELIREINNSKNKSSDIKVEAINENDPPAVVMNKLMQMEKKEMQESIGKDAYVINKKCASLTINDIDLDLPLNYPKNLGNISAKKLANSKDLWNLFNSDMINLITPQEANHLCKNLRNIMDKGVPGELEIYDSIYDAQEVMYDPGSGKNKPETHDFRDAEILDLSVESLENDSEEMKNLRMSKDIQKNNNISRNPEALSLSGNVRKSFHSSGDSVEQEKEQIIVEKERTIKNQSKTNSKGIKTIKRA
jgi:hypothetical protein